ncbi:MAG: hypothetical protein Q8K01_14030 [Sulfurimicrobium sp.]|nr:hypothetical protein [Sulfurimicrobium sp.]
MNKRNLILQSAVALALGVAAVGAQAATITSAPLSGALTTTGAAIATDIFGTGSEATLVKMPAVLYTAAAAGVANSTYKFTLSGGAVFGEPVVSTDITLGGTWAAAGVVTVINGGAVGDNTVTVKVDLAATAADTITFGAGTAGTDTVYLKELKSALSAAGGTVTIAAEVAGYTDNVTGTATPAILTSVNGVTLTTAAPSTAGTQPCPTTLSPVGGVCHQINVADASKKFQTVGAAANTFTTTGSVTYLITGGHAGQLNLNVVAGVKQEGLAAFGFSSGDTVALNMTGSFPSFQTGMGVYLKDNTLGGNCINTDTSATLGVVVAATKSTTAFSFNVPSASLPAAGGTRTYNLCLASDGTTEIAETSITGAADINYFNTRYVDGARTATTNNIQGLKKNGITQTVPYMLSGTNSYTTYLRVVNTGSITAGKINVTCYKDDGSSATGTVATNLTAKAAVIKTPAEVATACGAGGATTNANYSYVRVVGETDGMDAIQFMFNPNGTVTQFSTNNNQNN